jgi:nitroimidazol reductase NimA-like FMN-containing flavoprotein (pyridoxamine 5'-phosphate oxidase superfamily)
MSESDTGKMTSDQIMQRLSAPLIARLATVDPRDMQPHVVPVWYEWDGESLWISSFSSTRKNRDLARNPYAAAVIDEAPSGVENWAVIFEGPVELVTEPKDFLHQKTEAIYRRYLGAEGVLESDPQSWIRDPENTLIKLTPTKTRSWSTS